MVPFLSGGSSIPYGIPLSQLAGNEEGVCEDKSNRALSDEETGWWRTKYGWSQGYGRVVKWHGWIQIAVMGIHQKLRAIQSVRTNHVDYGLW